MSREVLKYEHLHDISTGRLMNPDRIRLLCNKNNPQITHKKKNINVFKINSMMGLTQQPYSSFGEAVGLLLPVEKMGLSI